MSSSHDITLTPQEQALIMRLKSFRVPEMAHILEEQLKDPNADLNTFMERMTAMVDAEWQARADKRFNRLMKEAHLRYPAADLDDTIYRPERQLDTQTIERLSTCHWIEEGKNLIVTGSSASGKTYLINAFCVTAMKQSKSVDQHIIIWHFRRIKLCRNNAGIFHPRTPGILVITVIEKIITVITRLKMGYFNFPDSANYGIK